MSDNSNPIKSNTNKSLFAQRFRGYFPVVIDVETAGFNAQTDALLEIAATTLSLDENSGQFSLDKTITSQDDSSIPSNNEQFLKLGSNVPFQRQFTSNDLSNI